LRGLSAGPLRRETVVLEVRDGLVAPWLVQNLPERSSVAPFTLERPLGADRSFDAWAAAVAPFPAGPTPEPPDFRKDVTVLFSAGVGATSAVRLVAAWPSAYEIVEGGDGQARERLTLVCEGFERVDWAPS
jgi:hypothetical protein